MVNTILGDELFFEEYLTSFCARFTAENLNLSYEEELPYIKKGVKFHNNLKAIQYSLNLLPDSVNITQKEIIEVADFINGPDSYINKGFRKTNVEINGADWLPCDADKIYPRIYSLLDCYYNLWNELEDPFEREAMFHINFIKIHPFENGNGRTGRILLNYSLIRNNLAPIIITKEEKQQYFDFVTNEDYRGFASFLKKRSLDEKQIINQLYEEKTQKKQK